MKIISILLLFVVINIPTAFCQSEFQIKIIDKNTSEPIYGASVTLSNLGNANTSDLNGLVIFKNLSFGTYIITVQYLGYNSLNDTLIFNDKSNLITIYLNPSVDEIEEVVIASNRSSRSIENIPTRIEFIAGEELDEKSNMKPGDIRMILNESTGIQTQQTSATSANASIRIQGLDGRYTQILKDGFPLYAGAASGLGLLQIPPLDLKQVELIKGSASTLYGGGAIAGLVNLISKTPEFEHEFKFHADLTSAKGLNLNSFYSKRNEKFGTTIFAAYNQNGAFDPAGINLTAIPKFNRITLNPKIFFYPNKKTQLIIGVNSSFEDRIGGDLDYISRTRPSNKYFEKNNTQRISSQINLEHKLNDFKKFNFKNSLSYYKRKITTPSINFEGIQYATFSEAGYYTGNEKSEWVFGVNLSTDIFNEASKFLINQRDYSQYTFGAFIQNITNVREWLEIESGFRTDYVIDYGFAYLPKISALIKINPKLSSRIGFGLGYKAPTIFTEESERIQYENVLPINNSINDLEKSYGANWDINYKTVFFDQVSFSINHLFFYTYINNPLLLINLINQNNQFQNINGHLDTKGTETNVKIAYKDFKLFLGYTYTDATLFQNGIRKQNPLTSKHRLNTVLFYEVEEKWKIGLESYYFSKQKLNDGRLGNDYTIMGFMVEKLLEKFSVYVNFENFLDVRQTKFENIYSGAISNPVFNDIYAPLDGFVVNGGIKIKL